MRAVYGDIEADTVCFALHFAHLRIVVVISKEVEGIEFFLQIVIGDVAGTFPVNERAVSCISSPFAVQFALLGGESQCRAFFGGDFVQTAVDEAIAPVGIFGTAMGIGHSVGIIAPECVYEESAVGYAFAEVCFVCGIQYSRTACQHIIYRVAECYHDGQLRLVALVVLMIGVIERLVAGVQITATGNKQQYAP